ncbi:50S ribosomal protein L24 [Candidatus Giovannonibacteria bacterium]|nr:50S ribosomal protein L24 [Candidatus Giovannonibacteria bacterium]
MTGRIKKGDQVFVISGKDRGRTGKILKVYSKDGRILVEGLNLRKRHKRARRSGEKGSIVEHPAPLAASKVMPKCPHCGKAARVGFNTSASGLKSRFCRKCKGEF